MGSFRCTILQTVYYSIAFSCISCVSLAEWNDKLLDSTNRGILNKKILFYKLSYQNAFFCRTNNFTTINSSSIAHQSSLICSPVSHFLYSFLIYVFTYKVARTTTSFYRDIWNRHFIKFSTFCQKIYIYK